MRIKSGAPGRTTATLNPSAVFNRAGLATGAGAPLFSGLATFSALALSFSVSTRPTVPPPVLVTPLTSTYELLGSVAS